MFNTLKIKAISFAVAMLTMSSAIACAQGAGGASGGGATGGPAGTNSAGTANSGGGRLGTGATVGAGGGPTPSSIESAPATGNAAVDAQDRAVDRKVKSICKGC